MKRILFKAVALLLMTVVGAATGVAQAVRPPARLVSPEVLPDHRVTFRFRAPNAKEVLLRFEGAKPAPMQKDDDGVWSLTTAPLEPDFYEYGFIMDGVTLMDTSNPLVKLNLLNNQSEVHVPGPASLPWEVNDVPHGILHHHFYKSTAIGGEEDFYVYTPPNYDAHAKTTYPVLYLLHGYSDDASGWLTGGQVNVIMDNLIAQGKAKPMLVVMPTGYGAPEILAQGWKLSTSNEVWHRNLDRFSQMLLGEIIPKVEREYWVTKKSNARAITGLSMGGSESLLTGFNHLDDFAWVGGFSAGGLTEDFAGQFPGLNSKPDPRLRLLWIACGTDDGLIAINRSMRAWFKSKGVKETEIETPGGHNWLVWRRNLIDFAPLLFR